jgi:hypothetical protein
MRFATLTYALAMLCFIGFGASAEVSRQIEAVSKAAKALEQNHAEEALTAVEEAFKLGLDSELASRALLIRAQAYEKAGKPAQALADYKSAIWMESLPASERPKAVDGRARVMSALGLSTRPAPPASPPASAPKTVAAAAPSRTPPAHRTTASASADAAPSSSSSSEGGIAGFFSNLFGGGSARSQQAEAKEEGWSARVTAPPAQVSSVKAEPRQEETASAKPSHHARPRTREATPEPQAAALVKEEEGGFNIDFGSAPSEHAAKEQAKAIKARTSDILINRELTLLPAGNQVRILAGPYKREGSAHALCSTMKARGVICKVTAAQ